MPYLVSKDGEQFGPFELDELTRYVQEGSILLTDHCWQEGWDQWFPIHSVVSVPVPLPVSRPKAATPPRTKSVETDEGTSRFPRTKLLVTSGIVVAILISCYFVSPYWTLYRLKRAVDQNDAIFVADHVDFPRFRESLKGAMMASLIAETSKGEGDGFEALGSAFGALMVGPMVDALVTPEGLIRIMQGREMDAILEEESGTSESTTQTFVAENQVVENDKGGMDVSKMGYETLNRFTVELAGKEEISSPERESVTLLFSRQGLTGWTLSGIRIGPH